jgi:Family of unknown function (DUF5941)
MLAWGGLALAYVLLGRTLRSLLAAAAPQGIDGAVSVLELYRDDGPLASALGRALGRRIPLPAVALLLMAALPLAVAIVLTGDDASDGLVAGVIAWVVLVGGLAAGRRLTDRLRWPVPPLLRAIEYAGLLAAITYHHYDTVYGLRHRGVPLPARVTAAGLGWDGRLVLGVVLLLAGALPAGFYALAGLVAGLFVSETVREWRRVRLGDTPVYDDEEDEAD